MLDRLALHPGATAAIGVSLLLSAACFVKLWRSDGNTAWRIFWSVAVFAPILGPLLYYALYDPPKPGKHQTRTWRSQSGTGRH
jgi:hypothetical protein